MIITKKRLKELLERKESEVERRFCEANEHRDEQRWLAERLDSFDRRISDMERQMYEINGIKERYDKVCSVVSNDCCTKRVL